MRRHHMQSNYEEFQWESLKSWAWAGQEFISWKYGCTGSDGETLKGGEDTSNSCKRFSWGSYWLQQNLMNWHELYSVNAGAQCNFIIKPSNRSRSGCHGTAAWAYSSLFSREFGMRFLPGLSWVQFRMQFVCFLPVGVLKLDIIIKLPLHVLIWQTYMAGDRVVLDPFCKPFSMGRYNLLLVEFKFFEVCSARASCQ